MNFVEATSKLIRGVTLEDLAQELGVTRGFLGQGRMDPSHPQHRSPPKGWEAAVAKLARKRAEELGRVAARVGTVEAGAKRAKSPRRAAAKKRTRKAAARRK
jgi:hypothetical protein